MRGIALAIFIAGVLIKGALEPKKDDDPMYSLNAWIGLIALAGMIVCVIGGW